jgi:hypothetical protein
LTITFRRQFDQGFGPAIVKFFKTEVFLKQGNMTPDEATAYLNEMLAAGRYLEDLAD